MKKGTIAAIFLSSMISSTNALSQEEISLEKKTAMTAYSNLQEKGKVVKIIGFNEKFSGAVTTVGTENSNEHTYIAEIRKGTDGARIFFRVYEHCKVSEEITDRIMTVNGQNIKGFSKCSILGVDDWYDINQNIYMIETKAGKDFVSKEFSEKEYVTVDLDGMPIPFSTERFNKMWNDINHPAI